MWRKTRAEKRLNSERHANDAKRRKTRMWRKTRAEKRLNSTNTRMAQDV